MQQQSNNSLTRLTPELKIFILHLAKITGLPKTRLILLHIYHGKTILFQDCLWWHNFPTGIHFISFLLHPGIKMPESPNDDKRAKSCPFDKQICSSYHECPIFLFHPSPPVPVSASIPIMIIPFSASTFLPIPVPSSITVKIITSISVSISVSVYIMFPLPVSAWWFSLWTETSTTTTVAFPWDIMWIITPIPPLWRCSSCKYGS